MRKNKKICLNVINIVLIIGTILALIYIFRIRENFIPTKSAIDIADIIRRSGSAAVDIASGSESNTYSGEISGI